MGYGSGFEPTKATIITNTATHTAKFVKLMALEDSVIHTLTAEGIDENLAGGDATARGREPHGEREREREREKNLAGGGDSE